MVHDNKPSTLIPIPNYEGIYSIDTEKQQVWSHKTCKYIKLAINSSGYYYNTLYKNKEPKHFVLHRLLFQAYNNYLPKFVDHIDQNKLNNSKENLREATHQENMQNRKVQKNNKLGIKNITKTKSNTYKTRIQHNCGRDHKTFKHLYQAEAYTDIMRKLLHKDFASK